MPFNLRGPELLILVLIVLLLFGAKRLPDVARGLGRSLRVFKAETKDLHGDADPTPDAPAVDAGSSPSLPPAPEPPAARPAPPASSSTPAPPQPERTES
jgi:sec-independent protein translocase protein TatA